jgi:hypothetical protein
MSLQHSPSIVRSGLICYLDPSNTRSYPGSGTTITDLSGSGNNGTLVGGATFSSVNNGVIVLNGSNGYIDVTLNLSASTYTVIGAARYVTNPGNTAGRTFSAKNNNWLMGHWQGTTQNYYAENWVSGAGTGTADLSWRTYAATGNPGLDTWQLYVNGISSVGPNANGTSGPNNFSIGTYSGAEFSNSHIGAFLVYNRVLTAAEILQNHNALKGRYSL